VTHGRGAFEGEPLAEAFGYWLIQQVRALSPEEGGSIPALALTALARADDRIRALRAGFQAHAAKPVETAELIYLVASLAGRTGRGERKAGVEE
jgi:CheY-like chemotaxis protein